MNALLISAGFVAAAWLARRVWRIPAKGLRAADIEALAWEQACEASQSSGGAGLRVGRPTIGMPTRPFPATLTPAN